MKRGFMGSSKKELDDSRTIRKSMREASIDTLQAAAIDSANQASNDTIQHVSDCIVHHSTVHFSNVYHGTVHRCNVHHGTVHLMSNDILHPVSTNIVHHSSIDTVHPALINTVHPARSTLFISCRSTLFTTILFITTLFIRTLFIIVLFIRQKLKPIYTTLMRQRPFHEFPHEQPMDHINMFEELVLFIFNEVHEDHHFCKLFPYTLAGDATNWFKKLPPGSLTA
ncbi:hypothetical protein Bca101_091024 [Brassica carinata]